MLFDLRDRNTIYAGADFDVDFDYGYPYGGSIFVSHDRGSSFTKGSTQFPGPVTSLAADPFRDGVLYAATGGSVFRSLDRGATWQGASDGFDLSGGLVNKVLADPVRPGRLYAGTSGGVYRTLDGAQTWQRYSPGLPVTLAVTDLAISPDGTRLHAATRGGGVFELDVQTELPSFPCAATATRLCLMGDRYAVDLLASFSREGPFGPGAARVLSDRAGFFSLPFATGAADLPEILVKMLPDGSFGVSGAPIFYSSLTTLPFVLALTDTATGRQNFYTSNSDVPLCGGVDLLPGGTTLASRPGVSPNADSGSTTLQLLGGRFSVTLKARVPDSDRTTEGTAFSSADSFGFFSLPELTGDALLPEVALKMTDARGLSGTFWLFYTGLTSLDYTLTVTDSVTGILRSYKSGTPFCGGADTRAFTDSPK